MLVSMSVDRSAAILAGCSDYGTRIVEIDPGTLPDHLRAALARCPEQSGVTNLDSTPWNNVPGFVAQKKPLLAVADPIAWLEWVAASCAEQSRAYAVAKDAEETAAASYVAWALQQPVESFVVKSYALNALWRAGLPVGVAPVICPDPIRYNSGLLATIQGMLSHKLDLAAVLASERNAADHAKRVADEAAATAEKVAGVNWVSAWVSRHMGAVAVARHSRGLLPGKEIRAAMEDHIFSGLSGFSAFPPLCYADLDHKDWCADTADGLAVSTGFDNDIDGIDEVAYEKLIAFESVALPLMFKVVPCWHIVSCDCCDVSHRVICAVAKYDNPFGHFERAYSL